MVVVRTDYLARVLSLTFGLPDILPVIVLLLALSLAMLVYFVAV